MSEAKKKARELVQKFKLCTETEDLISNKEAKQCALIVAKEIVEENEILSYRVSPIILGRRIFWEEVQKELESI